MANFREGGVTFIDAYNQTIHKDLAMTITTRVNTCNHYFLFIGDEEQEVRDDVGAASRLCK